MKPHATEIIYCANRCTRRGDEPGQKFRVQTEPPSLLCARCEDNIEHWLKTLPDLYALLPSFIEHGTAEPNPGSKATKRPEAPAPMRLEIIDLLDTRLGRKWLGTQPAADRRGVLGVLLAHALRLVEERPLQDPGIGSVSALCALLLRHRLWLFEREWIADLYEDLKILHRQVSDAVGDYRRPSVGRCHTDTEDGKLCDGKLYPDKAGGVRCSRCATTWNAGELRILGLAQQQKQMDSA